MLRIWRMAVVAPAVVAVVGVALSVAMFLLLISHNQAEQEQTFRSNAEERIRLLNEGLLINREAVLNVTAFMELNFAATAEDFEKFAGPIAARSPTIRAIAWIPVVSSQERESFVQRQRDAGQENFNITERTADGTYVPAGSRELYFPVTYVTPQQPDQSVMGLDLGSEPIRRKAVFQTLQSPDYVISNPIKLIRSGDITIYGSKLVEHRNPDSSREWGMPLVLLDLNEIVERSAPTLADDDVPPPTLYLFEVESGWATESFFPADSRLSVSSQFEGRFRFERLLQLGGRTWRAVVVSNNVAGDGAVSREAWIALAAGLLTTFFAVTYLNSVQQRGERIQREVTQRTRELSVANDRLQEAIDSIPGGFVMFNEEGRVELWNSRTIEFHPVMGALLKRNLPFDELMRTLASGRGLIGAEATAWIKDQQQQFQEPELHHEHQLEDGRWMLDMARRTENGARISLRFDITTARAAETALARQRRLLRSIVDHLPFWLTLRNADGQLMQVNQTMADDFQMGPEEIVVGIPPKFASDIATLGVLEDLDQKVLESGERLELPARVVLVKNTRQLRRVVCEPWRGPDGALAGVISWSEDVTDKLEAERAREESDARFRQSFENAAVGMALVSTNRRWLQVNNALCRMLGYSSAELLKMSFQDLTHPDDLQEVWARAQSMLDGQIDSSDHEKRYVHKNGSTVWVRISSSLLRDSQGVPLYFIAQILDITDRVKANTEIEEKNRLLEGILQNMTDGLMVLDQTGNILMMNPVLQALDKGRQKGKASSNVAERLGFMKPDGSAMQDADLPAIQVLSTGVPETGIQAMRWDGEQHDLLISAAPIFSEDKQRVTGSVSLVQDITELKRLDRLKTDFVSTVSHELRTPLASIVGYVDLILDGDVGEISEEQSDFLKIVSTNALRLNALIGDLLDVEKMESGRISLDRKPVPMQKVVQDVCNTFAIMAKDKGLGLEMDLAETSDATVIGDADRLTQVASNLVSNAIKYTKKGTVTVSLMRTKDSAVLTVRDSGIGMTAQTRSKLFTKFFRADDEYTKTVGGTGLGLAIVRSIVMQHGGTIDVQSAEN